MRAATAVLAAAVLCLSIPFVVGEEPGGQPPLLSSAITVDGGQIYGAKCGTPGVAVFKGIPYAAPPVGELRWKAPQPVIPWEGIRACTEFGNSCTQPADATVYKVQGPQSEDCLTLNIWSNALSSNERKPVIVFIHGGSFVQGSSAKPLHSGEYISAEGVVFVSLNYRLGPFGFFGHPALSAESPEGISGNYGLLDIIFALQWVKRNIARFGGNPDSVTIAGSASGAALVTCLMVSPLATGLFHRAIAQSGTALFLKVRLNVPSFSFSGEIVESLEEQGVAFQRKLGIGDADMPLAHLRGIAAGDLLTQIQPAVGILGRGWKFSPVIDGLIIPEEPLAVFQRGEQAKVPFLIGSNRDESTVFLTDAVLKMEAAGYESMIQNNYKQHADRVLQLFPADREGGPDRAFNRLVTLSYFTWPAKYLAGLHADSGSAAWLYQFDRVMLLPQASRYGAYHTAELAYVLGKANIESIRQHMVETDRQLARNMMAYWVAFARSGDPNFRDGLKWPGYRRDTDLQMTFHVKPEVENGVWSEECSFMNEMYLGVAD